MQLTKDFQIEEFYCRDGTPVPWNMVDEVKELAQNLQVLRDELGEPIRINSGYRNPTYNDKVGGEDNSYHMKCMAADIVVKSKTPKQLAAVIEKLIAQKKMKQGGLGVYASFVHYDIRNTKARW
jgi:uncharacterized protein YcbK (DUF882 family)